MNDELARALIKQLKLINFWITLFGILLMIALAILGFVIWKVASGISDATQQITSIKNSTSNNLNLKRQLCEGTNATSTYLKNNTDIC